MNNFNFYMPIDELVKGKDDKGQEVYKFKGLASTDSKDADDEFLDYNGFDLSQFKFVNYDHRKDPKYIIGEPTNAKIIPGTGLVVEGNIWGDTEVGKQVVDLMKTLEKSGSKTKLGISVEGKATERDTINPKRITKAKITAIALCPIPKNGDTWATLIQKGFSNEILSNEDKDFDIEKSVNGGDVQYLIDVTNPETGMRYTVDKNFCIKIEKAMTTQAGSGKPLIRESLEKKVKNLISSNPTDEVKKAIVTISKAVEQGKLIIQ